MYLCWDEKKKTGPYTFNVVTETVYIHQHLSGNVPELAKELLFLSIVRYRFRV